MKKIVSLLLCLMTVFSLIPCASANLWDTLVESAGDIWDDVTGSAADAWNTVTGLWEDNKDGIADTAKGLWEDLNETAGNAFSDFREAVSFLADKTSEGYTKLKDWLDNADENSADLLKEPFFGLLKSAGVEVKDTDAFWKIIRDYADDHGVSLIRVAKSMLSIVWDIYEQYGAGGVNSIIENGYTIADMILNRLEEDGVISKSDSVSAILELKPKLDELIEK